MNAMILYKFVACLVLAMNLAVKWFNLELFSFSFFPYLDPLFTNMAFSGALILIVLLVNEKNYKFFTLFNMLIFIDTILVYGNLQNFLIHILILVVLTQIFYRISAVQSDKKSITEHLLDKE